MTDFSAPPHERPPHVQWWPMLVIVVLSAAVLASHIAGSWRFDDPLIVQYVQTLPDFYTPFINAAAWRELGAPFFTPLLTLIFQLAYQLFGLNTVGHYLLHLTGVTAVACLTCALVARHSTTVGGLCAAALFLLGAPTSVVAAQLMATHYVWGLVLALASIFVWQRFVVSRQWRWAALSAVLYLLAMLGKEIFAPLPLVLFVLALGAAPRHWWALVGLAGHTLAAVGYVAWRAGMIGTAVGGYGGVEGGLHMVAASVPLLAQSVWGTGWMAWLGACCALLLALRTLWRHGGMAVALLACATAGVLLPFGFVSATVDTVHLRLSFLPWWALCVCIGFAFGGKKGHATRPARLPQSDRPPTHTVRMARAAQVVVVWAPLAALFGVVLHTQQQAQAQLAQETDVYDAYARRALSPAGGGWALLQGHAATHPYFQYGLVQMARHHGLPPTTLEAFAQQAYYDTGVRTGVAYSASCHCMAAVQAPPPAPPLDAATTVPTVKVHFETPTGRGMRWQLAAPEPDGTWYLQTPALGLTMVFTTQGAIDFALPPWLLREKFRIVWRSADGRWTQTPLLPFPTSAKPVHYGPGLP